jgi:hypothetical protein
MFLCIFSLTTSKLPPPPPPPTTTECVLFHVYQFSHTPCYVTTSTEGRFLVFYEQFEHHQLSQIEINFSNNKYSLFFHVHKPSTYTLLRWIKVHGWQTLVFSEWFEQHRLSQCGQPKNCICLQMGLFILTALCALCIEIYDQGCSSFFLVVIGNWSN